MLREIETHNRPIVSMAYSSYGEDGSFDEEGAKDEDKARESDAPSRAIEQSYIVHRGICASPTCHYCQTLIPKP